MNLAGRPPLYVRERRGSEGMFDVRLPVMLRKPHGNGVLSRDATCSVRSSLAVVEKRKPQ